MKTSIHKHHGPSEILNPATECSINKVILCAFEKSSDSAENVIIYNVSVR